MTAAAIWSAAPMNDRPSVLILGGTAEAVDLANRIAGNFNVTYSLAGRTKNPALPDNVTVRTGGFGGIGALTGWMRENGTDAVVDATHPFAAQIAGNAAEACVAADIPRLKLRRAEWVQQQGENWQTVSNVQGAADALPFAGQRAFLSVGRQEIAAFAAAKGAALIIRSIDPPDDPDILPGATFITGRGPFTVADETALLQEHNIDVLVSKNAGGDSTYAKIAAARKLGIKVIMIERPPVPPGDVTDNAATALDWLHALFG
jgi:precorrin-6A/cobalt-precorrin-6A reductase